MAALISLGEERGTSWREDDRFDQLDEHCQQSQVAQH
jgi:hypothetical protein